MAGWVCNPAGVLARLEVLLSEYPFLSGRGFVLPAVLIFVAPLATAGHSSEACEFIFYGALCGCFFALLVAMHFYDLARRRVQVQAAEQGRGVGIRRDCCFVSSELQESFEAWRIKGIYWRVYDWATLTFMVVFVVKLLGLKGVCGPLHILWALVASASSASRFLFQDRLSPTSRSVLSMFHFTYCWVTRTILLVNGDKCVVACLGSHLYSGSVASGVVMSILVYITAHLLNPVSQPCFPWKLTSGLVGYTTVGYFHILRRGDSIDWEVDKDRWGLLTLFVGQVLTSLAVLNFCTAMCEADMHKFLSTGYRAVDATRLSR